MGIGLGCCQDATFARCKKSTHVGFFNHPEKPSMGFPKKHGGGEKVFREFSQGKPLIS
jgi:hypothetical protein